jgi:hypothetical protein
VNTTCGRTYSSTSYTPGGSPTADITGQLGFLQGFLLLGRMRSMPGTIGMPVVGSFSRTALDDNFLTFITTVRAFT